MNADRLEAAIKFLGSALVAFSGGADSSFLLAFAADVMGRENVIAGIGDSPSLPRAELVAALGFADRLGVIVVIVHPDEVRNEKYLKNPPDRCYHCKSSLFRCLRDEARKSGTEHILDGTNADDLKGHRPGLRAAKEHGVISPLADACLTKKEIRELSRRMGLPTWDKPAMACLASRFPHGMPITIEKLSRVERAEFFLRSLGFRNVRVRDHDGLARIEVDREKLPELMVMGEKISMELRSTGFRHVTVDLEGFRSGNLSPQSPGRDSSHPEPRT